MIAWLRDKLRALRRTRELLRQADPKVLAELVDEVRLLVLAATRYLPAQEPGPGFEEDACADPDAPDADPDAGPHAARAPRRPGPAGDTAGRIRQIRLELEQLSAAVARPEFRRLPPRQRLALRQGLLDSRRHLLTAIQSRAEPTRFRQ